MPSAAVEAVFRTRLEANWNIADGVILGSNEVMTAPSDGSPFLIIHVEVFEPSPPIVNDDNEDGNYFELAVVIPYRYQFDWSANSPP
jgi:hypothetical protein